MDKRILNILPEISNYAVLKLSVFPRISQLEYKYEEKICNHNLEMNDIYYNSGFDLMFSNSIEINEDFKSVFIDLNVKAEMTYFTRNSQDEEYVSSPCGFFIFPRSSISKTPLMLANHTGIIDSSYRGNLMVAVRKFPTTENDNVYRVNRFERLFQITHPSLCRIFVMLVDETDLSNTKRGVGGFGSTGKF